MPTSIVWTSNNVLDNTHIDKSWVKKSSQTCVVSRESEYNLVRVSDPHWM